MDKFSSSPPPFCPAAETCWLGKQAGKENEEEVPLLILVLIPLETKGWMVRRTEWKGRRRRRKGPLWLKRRKMLFVLSLSPVWERRVFSFSSFQSAQRLELIFFSPVRRRPSVTFSFRRLFPLFLSSASSSAVASLNRHGGKWGRKRRRSSSFSFPFFA